MIASFEAMRTGRVREIIADEMRGVEVDPLTRAYGPIRSANALGRLLADLACGPDELRDRLARDERDRAGKAVRPC